MWPHSYQTKNQAISEQFKCTDLRWPTTVTANSNSPRQIKIHHGKFKFTAANSNSPRQIQIRHGKFKFTTANLKFTTANSNSPRQIQIHHGKFKLATAKIKYTAANSNSPRQIQRVCLLFVLLQELGLSLGALGWFL